MNCEPTFKTRLKQKTKQKTVFNHQENCVPFTLGFIFKYNKGYRKQLLRQSMFKFKEVTSDAVSICTFCPFFFSNMGSLVARSKCNYNISFRVSSLSLISSLKFINKLLFLKEIMVKMWRNATSILIQLQLILTWRPCTSTHRMNILIAGLLMKIEEDHVKSLNLSCVILVGEYFCIIL